MTYGVYAMRDTKTGFLSPTLEANDEAACRNFVHAVWNSDGILHSFCSDFDLFRLGQFDTDSGSITPNPVPVHVMAGSDALRAGAKGGFDGD